MIAAVLVLHLLITASNPPTALNIFPSIPVPVFSPPHFGLPSPQPAPTYRYVPPPARVYATPPVPVPVRSATTTSQDVGKLGAQIGSAVFLIGLLVVLLTLLILALLSLRGRNRAGSRTRAILDAGLKALPALVIMLMGLVGVIVGFLYLAVLFVYLMIDFFISIFVEAFTNRPLHLGGTEYGDLGGHTLLYLGLGSVLLSLGSFWLGAIGTRGVVRFRRAKALTAGQVFGEPPSPAPPPPPTPHPPRRDARPAPPEAPPSA